jgi:hypothetical protein
MSLNKNFGLEHTVHTYIKYGAFLDCLELKSKKKIISVKFVMFSWSVILQGTS